MPKFTRQSIAVLLVSCLLIDPLKAFAFYAPVLPVSPRLSFEQQAVVPPIVETHREIVGSEIPFRVRRETEQQITRRRFLQIFPIFLIAAHTTAAHAVIQDAIPPDNSTVIEAAVSAAQTALQHLEKDGWASSAPGRQEVIQFLKYLIRSKDFKVIPNTTTYPVAANLMDPPSKTVRLGNKVFFEESLHNRAAIMAHEAAHTTPLQEARRQFVVQWEKATPRGTDFTPPDRQKDYKRVLAMRARDEFEAVNFELAYRVSEARSLGYRDMRDYFETAAKEAVDPYLAVRYRSFKSALLSWDLEGSAPVQLNQNVVLMTQMLRALTDYDPNLLYAIARLEGVPLDLSAAKHPEFEAWALSWLNDPAFYNPTEKSMAPTSPAPILSSLIPPLRRNFLEDPNESLGLLTVEEMNDGLKVYGDDAIATLQWKADEKSESIMGKILAIANPGSSDPFLIIDGLPKPVRYSTITGIRLTSDPMSVFPDLLQSQRPELGSIAEGYLLSADERQIAEIIEKVNPQRMVDVVAISAYILYLENNITRKEALRLLNSRSLPADQKTNYFQLETVRLVFKHHLLIDDKPIGFVLQAMEGLAEETLTWAGAENFLSEEIPPDKVIQIIFDIRNLLEVIFPQSFLGAHVDAATRQAIQEWPESTTTLLIRGYPYSKATIIKMANERRVFYVPEEGWILASSGASGKEMMSYDDLRTEWLKDTERKLIVQWHDDAGRSHELTEKLLAIANARTSEHFLIMENSFEPVPYSHVDETHWFSSPVVDWTELSKIFSSELSSRRITYHHPQVALDDESPEAQEIKEIQEIIHPVGLHDEIEIDAYKLYLHDVISPEETQRLLRLVGRKPEPHWLEAVRIAFKHHITKDLQVNAIRNLLNTLTSYSDKWDLKRAKERLVFYDQIDPLIAEAIIQDIAPRSKDQTILFSPALLTLFVGLGSINPEWVVMASVVSLAVWLGWKWLFTSRYSRANEKDELNALKTASGGSQNEDENEAHGYSMYTSAEKAKVGIQSLDHMASGLSPALRKVLFRTPAFVRLFSGIRPQIDLTEHDLEPDSGFWIWKELQRRELFSALRSYGILIFKNPTRSSGDTVVYTLFNEGVALTIMNLNSANFPGARDDMERWLQKKVVNSPGSSIEKTHRYMVRNMLLLGYPNSAAERYAIEYKMRLEESPLSYQLNNWQMGVDSKIANASDKAWNESLMKIFTMAVARAEGNQIPSSALSFEEAAPPVGESENVPPRERNPSKLFSTAFIGLAGHGFLSSHWAVVGVVAFWLIVIGWRVHSAKKRAVDSTTRIFSLGAIVLLMAAIEITTVVALGWNLVPGVVKFLFPTLLYALVAFAWLVMLIVSVGSVLWYLRPLSQRISNLYQMQRLQRSMTPIQKGFISPEAIHAQLEDYLDRQRLHRIVDKREFTREKDREIPLETLSSSPAMARLAHQVKLRGAAIVIIMDEVFAYYRSPQKFRSLLINKRDRTISIGEILLNRILEDDAALSGFLALLDLLVLDKANVLRLESRADPEHHLRSIIGEFLTIPFVVESKIQKMIREIKDLQDRDDYTLRDQRAYANLLNDQLEKPQYWMRKAGLSRENAIEAASYYKQLYTPGFRFQLWKRGNDILAAFIGVLEASRKLREDGAEQRSLYPKRIARAA